MSSKNITRTVHARCALFRIAAPMGTSGLRAGSPSRANGPSRVRRCRTMRARTSGVERSELKLFTSSIGPGPICVEYSFTRSLRSERHSACSGVLLFEGTPSALHDRFGLTPPNLRAQLRRVEYNTYCMNKQRPWRF
jgi:hypothetical protein